MFSVSVFLAELFFSRMRLNDVNAPQKITKKTQKSHISM